jgi:hypothetical protein
MFNPNASRTSTSDPEANERQPLGGQVRPMLGRLADRPRHRTPTMRIIRQRPRVSTMDGLDLDKPKVMFGAWR